MSHLARGLHTIHLVGIGPEDAIGLAIGFMVSFVVALMAIKGFVRYLGHGKLAPFAWYRIVVAPVFYLLTRGSGL